jgi:hypothetical protein
MALIQRDFRKDKPKPLRVRIVSGVKILAFPACTGTSFERAVR